MFILQIIQKFTDSVGDALTPPHQNLGSSIKSNQIKSMGSKTSSSTRAKPFIFFLLFLSSSLFFIVSTFRPKPNLINTHGLQHQAKISNGFNIFPKEFKGKNVKVGLVNIEGDRIEATACSLPSAGDRSNIFLGVSRSNHKERG